MVADVLRTGRLVATGSVRMRARAEAEATHARGPGHARRAGPSARDGQLQLARAVGNYGCGQILRREVEIGDGGVRRSPAAASSAGEAPPSSVHSTLSQSGAQLPPSVRAYFEPRFDRDFGDVRIHTDPSAARSAADVRARAYTVGRDIVFGRGEYKPGSRRGRRLLAHELAHVVQQSRGPRRLQRALVRQGSVSIQVDYSPVVGLSAADRPDRIIAMITAYTGSAPSAADETAIRALSAGPQTWLLFAMRLHESNTVAASSLGRATAVGRLLAHAPSGAHAPLPDPHDDFVREAMRVSGWSETAQAERLSAPSAGDLSAIDTLLNPGGSAPPALDVAALRTRLVPALRHFLGVIDPARWTTTGTRSLSAFQAIGDVVLAHARTFFSPFADIARGNVFDLTPRWHASANIFDVATISPTRSTRMGYLRNRATIVGAATTTSSRIIDANIFRDVHFSGRRDRAELDRILTPLEADPAIRATVDRLIRTTGRKHGFGAATRIGLATVVDLSSRTRCEDHWRGIETVCHEVLHALVHPRFQAAASTVGRGQIIREGFTEVLSTQLYNGRIRPTTLTHPAFKARLETGVPGAPCPTPHVATIGYGSAGRNADAIRTRVGDENFRAAYFLGRPELAGVP